MTQLKSWRNFYLKIFFTNTKNSISLQKRKTFWQMNVLWSYTLQKSIYSLSKMLFSHSIGIMHRLPFTTFFSIGKIVLVNQCINVWPVLVICYSMMLMMSMHFNTLSFTSSLRKNWIKLQKLITSVMRQLASTTIIKTSQICCIMLMTSISQVNGIGGTIKHLAAYSSLQKATTG